MLALYIFLLVLGLALLIKGADWFVDGSSGIASKLKIPALIVGLTIVAFGTSAPELCVSVTSAIKCYWNPEYADIAVGNVVGSNICNILLILGVSAIIHDLPVSKNSLWLDIPILILSSVLLVGLGAMGEKLEWWDGLILILVFVAYMTVLLVGARKKLKQQKTLEAEPAPPESKAERPKGKVKGWYSDMCQKSWFLVLLTLVGLGMVVGGGTLLVNNARAIAEYFSVPDRIIALTIVAVGTSLPELVTSVIAAVKGQTDIAVGNIIGSNIFNILLIAGVSSLVYPLNFALDKNLIDALVALGAAVLLYIVVLLPKRKIGKIGGFVFLACFIGYYIYLFLAPAV